MSSVECDELKEMKINDESQKFHLRYCKFSKERINRVYLLFWTISQGQQRNSSETVTRK